MRPVICFLRHLISIILEIITLSSFVSFSPLLTKMPQPLARLRRVYNSQERSAIDPFKSDYLKATTPAGRKLIAQVHIFPALFNHWASVGIDLNDDEMKTRSDVSLIHIYISRSFKGLNKGPPTVAKERVAYKEKTTVGTW